MTRRHKVFFPTMNKLSFSSWYNAEKVIVGLAVYEYILNL